MFPSKIEENLSHCPSNTPFEFCLWDLHSSDNEIIIIMLTSIGTLGPSNCIYLFPLPSESYTASSFHPYLKSTLCTKCEVLLADSDKKLNIVMR